MKTKRTGRSRSVSEKKDSRQTTVVAVKTSSGTLIVKGSGLHIDKLNLETGDVSIDGKINSMQYFGGDKSRSKLSRLFR